MSIYENIYYLSEIPFTITEFHAVNKNVTPPDAFICSNETVRFERFFYVVKGTIVFDDERHNKLKFSSGDIIYLPDNVTYRSYWEQDEKGEFLSINFIITDKSGRIINLSDDITFCLNDSKGELYKMFFETFEIWKHSARGYGLKCKSQLLNILDSIAKNSQKLEIKNKNRDILKAVLYIENNFLSNFTVEELLLLANLKECQFRRSFKRLKGMSPIKYRNFLRLNKAAEMLKSGEYSVIETSMIVGFDDSGYFSRLFKKQFGVSPSEFIP